MNRRHRLIVPILLLAFTGPAGAAPKPPIGDVMAGEFALQLGDLPAASRHYLLAASASTDPGLAGRATRIALLANQPVLAGRALARWRKLAPDSQAMHASAVRLALGLGEHESAMEDARALLALPADAGFPLVLVSLAEATGDEQVIARSVLRELFDEAALPEDFPSWLRVASLARRLGDRGFSDRVVEAGLLHFPGDPRARLLQASRLRESGDRDGARTALQSLVSSGDLDADLRRSAANELAQVGEPRLAADLLAQGPQDIASLGQRAAWLLADGDRAALQSLYAEARRAEQREPEPERRLLLGHLAEALSLWREAERWYRGVTDGDGRDLALIRLARTLAVQGRLDAALETLHEFQASESADGERVRDSYLAEAELLEADGRAGQALAVLDRGLAVFEGDPVLLYGRAMASERAGNVDRALADLRRIIDENPRDAHALNAYGYTLADRRGDYAGALPYLKRAHAIEPGSAAILDSLGWIELQLGRRAEGLAWLQKAWGLVRDAEIAAHLGEALWLAGRRDEARAIWREGAAIDPKNPALLKAMEKFTP